MKLSQIRDNAARFTVFRRACSSNETCLDGTSIVLTLVEVAEAAKNLVDWPSDLPVGRLHRFTLLEQALRKLERL